MAYDRARELERVAASLRKADPVKYDLLATTLQALVPLRMAELRFGYGRGQLAELGRAQTDVIGSCGDSLLYRTEDTSRAFKALLTGIACAALLADGGITVLGLHWCDQDDASCPNGRPTLRPLREAS